MLFLFSHQDPMVVFISILAILAIVIGLFLKKIKQPYIIGYILIGALLGEQGLGLIKDLEQIHNLGEIGIIFLLFFIGMEISLPDLVQQWKVAVVGTLLQVIISVLAVLGIGYFLEWELQRCIVLGFVISLSSSAIIIKILQDKKLVDSRIGKNVLSILLTQDVIVVPLVIITSLMGGESEPIGNIILMLVGGVLMIAVLVYLYTYQRVKLPFEKQIEDDHELQVFLAIFFCFGGALLSSLFGLSGGLGAFVGGIIMRVANSTDWIHETLHSFRVLFVAFFFISIGLQMNFNFIYEHSAAILSVLLVVYLINHAINSLILRLFSCTWKEALFGGALLAQIGELSFLLSFTAYNLGIIASYGYNFTISLISLTLVISPFWVSLSEKLIHRFVREEENLEEHEASNKEA